MSIPIPSGSKYEELLYYECLSGTSWESDISVGAVFEDFSVNMVSVGPEMMPIVGSKIHVNTQTKILALYIKYLQ